jgi:hypothetical protein
MKEQVRSCKKAHEGYSFVQEVIASAKPGQLCTGRFFQRTVDTKRAPTLDLQSGVPPIISRTQPSNPYPSHFSVGKRLVIRVLQTIFSKKGVNRGILLLTSSGLDRVSLRLDDSLAPRGFFDVTHLGD